MSTPGIGLLLTEDCPAPFLKESKFPPGGYELGRFCATSPEVAGGVSCCLPCPAENWLYPDNFYQLTRIAGPLAITSFALEMLLVLTFIILPSEKTKRHYLNSNLLIATMFIQIGLIVPWSVRPNQCYDAITPNDLKTSATCGWSGSFLLLGCAAGAVWVLIRSLNMHILVVWDHNPGKNFFWWSQVLGWLAAGVLLTIEVLLSGVSQRFGDYCHINSHNAMAFIGPLIGVAGACFLLQLVTFGYCLHVYMKDYLTQPGVFGRADERRMTVSSFSDSVTSRAVYRRVRKVIQLQWRSMAITFVLLIEIAFFLVVFVVLNQDMENNDKNTENLVPWVACIIEGHGKDACLKYASKIDLPEKTLIGVLVVLSTTGMSLFVLLARWEMITGWWQLIGPKSKDRDEFVSAAVWRYQESALSNRSSDAEKYGIRYSAPDAAQMGFRYPSGDSEKYGFRYSEMPIPSPSMEPANLKTAPRVFTSPLTRIEETNYRAQEFEAQHMARTWSNSERSVYSTSMGATRGTHSWQSNNTDNSGMCEVYAQGWGSSSHDPEKVTSWI